MNWQDYGGVKHERHLFYQTPTALPPYMVMKSFSPRAPTFSKPPSAIEGRISARRAQKQEQPFMLRQPPHLRSVNARPASAAGRPFMHGETHLEAMTGRSVVQETHRVIPSPRVDYLSITTQPNGPASYQGWSLNEPSIRRFKKASPRGIREPAPLGQRPRARDPLKPCGDEGPTELASEFTRKFPGHWFVDEETGRRSPRVENPVGVNTETWGRLEGCVFGAAVTRAQSKGP